ncbi:MAG: hypothetical protein L3J91_03500, partial [Thermoplasmata archaeon]|nr:hypothetical protein [Thermoplasmata archaeon]
NQSGVDTVSVRASYGGAVAWANTSITVTPPPPTGGSGPPAPRSPLQMIEALPVWLWPALGALAVAVGVLAWRTRRSPPVPPEAEEPMSGGEYVDTLGLDVTAPLPEPGPEP